MHLTNCRIRTWSRIELSYEYFIINLFANAGFIRGAGKSKAMNASLSIYLRTAGVIRGAGPARQHLLTPDVR